MSQAVEARLERIPIINALVRLFKRIRVPGFEGLSFYDLLEIYIYGIIKGTLSSRASSIAFSLFMALFPLIIFLVTLLPLLTPFVGEYNGESFDQVFLGFLESFLPDASANYFAEIYEGIKQQNNQGWLSTTFLLSIFLVANGVNAIFGGFNNSYHVELGRNFFRQYVYALLVGLVLSVMLIVGAMAFLYFEIYAVEPFSEYLGKAFGIKENIADNYGVVMAKVLFFMLLSYLTAAILYFFGTTKGDRPRFFSPGALMTTLLFLLTSYLFGVYVEKFARYNELYGALGGLLILMVYIWLNSNILLLGFEMNATIKTLRKDARFSKT